MPAADRQCAVDTQRQDVCAVPVNIHGQNWLWINSKAVARQALGQQMPKTLGRSHRHHGQGEGRRASSRWHSPGQKTWERGLFNAVLARQGWPCPLERPLFGKRDQAMMAQGPEFKRRRRDLQAKLKFLRRRRAHLAATGTTPRHLSSRARLRCMLMGDWAKGEFAAAWPDRRTRNYACAMRRLEGAQRLRHGRRYLSHFPS